MRQAADTKRISATRTTARVLAEERYSFRNVVPLRRPAAPFDAWNPSTWPAAIYPFLRNSNAPSTEDVAVAYQAYLAHEREEERTALLRTIATSVSVSTSSVPAEPREVPTLRSWGRAVLDRREARGVKDIKNERGAWRLHVETAPFADDPLDTLSKRAVKEWVEGLLRKPPTSPNGQKAKKKTIGRKRVKETLLVLNYVLDDAVDAELIEVNRARGMKVPGRKRRAYDTWTYLDVAEQTRLLGVIPEPFVWVVHFAMGTLLRPGELAGLELADVHVDGDSPHVVVRFGEPDDGEEDESATKSGEPRVVPLFGAGLRAARAWIDALPSFAGKNPHGLMFPRESGEPRHDKRFFKRQWPQWIRAAKLEPQDRKERLPSAGTTQRGTRGRPRCSTVGGARRGASRT